MLSAGVLCVRVLVCTQYLRVIAVGFYYPFYILKLFLGKRRDEKSYFFFFIMVRLKFFCSCILFLYVRSGPL